MDGENEKGKRERARRGEGGGKLMTICACEQVSAEKEEGGGREKPMEKYARASKCQLFHFQSYF